MTTFAPDGSVVAAPQTNGQPVVAPADVAPDPQPDPPTPVLDPAPVTIDPEPAPPAEPEPEVIENPGAEVAPLPVYDAGWPHDWLEFRGDTLGVRIPAPDAYAPVQIAEMGHTQPGLSQRLSVRFLEMHIAPQSYERVLYRIMDPDEPDFTGKALGELVNVLSALNSVGDATG